jgi:hypothetical protein
MVIIGDGAALDDISAIRRKLSGKSGDIAPLHADYDEVSNVLDDLEMQRRNMAKHA